MTAIKNCCNILINQRGVKINFFTFFFWKERIKIKKEKSTQEWLPFDKILENGIIIREKVYIKIIKVIPINYDLKSNLEKEAILNSYKLFLKTCDFNIQILIQSKKENLSKHFSNLKEISKKENNKKIKEISEKYMNFIKTKNEENKSSSKNFYIIVKFEPENQNKEYEEINFMKTMANNYLSESYFKIKDSLSRCGNLVYDLNTKKEIEKVLISFFENQIME